MARQGRTIYVPIVDMADTYDGRTYDKALNGSGIHAIDAATGETLWSYRLDEGERGASVDLLQGFLTHVAANGNRCPRT